MPAPAAMPTLVIHGTTMPSKFLSLVLIAALLGCAAPSVVESANKKAAIDLLVQGEMKARGIPGAQVTIVQKGKIVFTGVYGQANIETKQPVTEKTLFQINSISKAFAGVAAMQLVEAGKLNLDAPIATYLDEAPASWNSITVRHIMSHSSGLSEIVDDNIRTLDGAEPDAAWAKVLTLPVKFQPGEKFEYIQTNYVALGKIIEKITGRSFSEFVRARQFQKARMQRTGFAPVSGSSGDPGIATLYTFLTLKIEGMRTVGAERSEAPFVRNEVMPEYVRPVGSIQSTSTDMAKWIIALQKLKLMNQGSLEQLWKPQPLNDGSYRAFGRVINAYGLGWPSARRDNHPAVTLTGGARSALFVYPKDDLTVIVLTNLMGGAPEKFVEQIAATYLPGIGVEAK
jgi:CubicO group peptidase (beta-lactamase class C family)